MKKHLFLILILLVLTFIFNLPVVLHSVHCIPGFFSTDESSAVVWNSWRIKFALFNNLSIKRTDFIAYPFGFNFYFNQPIGYIWYFINFLLAIFTTPILTYNIQAILNFFFTAVCSYFLVYFLTKSRSCGLFSGIVFGFSPYIFVRSWQHLGETYLWLMVLFLWCLVQLKDKNTFLIKSAFVLSIVLTTINFDITYYSSIIAGVFVTYIFFYNWHIKYFKNREFIRNDVKFYKRFFLVNLIAFVILIPQFFPIFKNVIFPINKISSAYNPYHRPFEDLFIQSAKPLGYLLLSTEHPIFGKFTKNFVGSPLWGVSYTEHQLYLGWTTIILALYAVRIWRRRRKLARKGKLEAENQYEKDNFYIGFFIFLAIVAWLFSQPPWWQMGKFKILLPSFFMYKILPMYRAYCRFGIVVLLTMAILAGYGLKYIIAKCKMQNAKIAITTLCCGLILFEFWHNPFTHYIDLSKYPAVYDWLKTQSAADVIAEYPMIKDGVNERYKFYQTIHHKKLINGAVPGMPGYQVKLQILDLGAEKTPFILKYLGAEYVIVHTKEYEQSEDFVRYNQLKEIRNHPDLELIKKFKDGIEVYKIK